MAKKVQKPQPAKQAELQVEEVQEEEATGLKNHYIIAESDSKLAKWYIIHTYSGHEARVAVNMVQRVKTMKLEDKVLEILIPTQNKILIKRGKKKTIKEKLFPGYMLVKMILADDSWLAVRTTPGVTSFVGIGTKPTPLPAEEVKSIQKFMKQEAPKYKASFSVGEAVRIIEGPFADFLGTVDSIDDAKGKVNVLVSIFGRETPVELDFLQVSKI
jgi:transcription termination/antitermination protein NusG